MSGHKATKPYAEYNLTNGPVRFPDTVYKVGMFDKQRSSVTQVSNEEVSAAIDAIAKTPTSYLIKEMLKNDQIELPVIHRFGPGVYIRECFIPAGTVIVGHEHKHEHMNVMIKGRLILVGSGGVTSECKGPFCFVAPPGRKTAIILEDVVWQNIYATEETDIGTLEAMLFEDCQEAIEDKQERFERFKKERQEDIEDYLIAIKEFGFDADTVWKISQHAGDLITLRYPSQKIRLDDSPIHGKGLFATATIEPGEIIYPARVSDKRTIAGRYTNHSKCPNAIMVLLSNGDLNLVATKKIIGCTGGRVGEEVTLDYRQAMGLQWERRTLCLPESR